MTIHTITPNDRGVFLVTTQGSEHLWEIEDDGSVFVTRESQRVNPYGLNMINGRRNVVTSVEAWPMLGGTFLYCMSGDIPWTRSSTIRNIERIEA